MTERDTDIEFDFFEEPETREAARPERPPGTRPRGPRPPIRTPQGVTPLLRLVGLIAFAIVIVLLLVYAIQGCQSSSKHAKYENYMNKVSQIGSNSHSIGVRLGTLLGQPGLKASDVQNRLAGLARDEQQNIDAARAINPPGRLRDENSRMIDALQYRYSGIVGLGDSLRQALATKNLAAAQAGALLEAPALRLLASDVVWDDSFRDPSKQLLRDQGVGDVRVPNSNFVQNPDFFTAAGLGAVVTRLRGANVSPTVGGLHGTNIVSTKALPQGTELSASATSPQPVVAGTNLGFAVTVEDSGDSAEVHIPVKLTVTNGTKDIVKTQSIAFINKKEQTTVTFRNIQLDSSFFGSQSTKVKVDVTPVPNEHNTTNNTATYSVIFSLPQ
jgi:CARDB